ncbi:MAG: HAD family hydrolase [Candidatus Bipolaricaulota bacterium]|nr:HAD family hydrolase [Candidatus Bipolaricaulota bacterium]
MPVRLAVGEGAFTGSGFLFDKDGTLVSFDHWLAVMGERARRLAGELELAEPEHQMLRRFMGLDRDRPGPTRGTILHLPRCDVEDAVALYLASRRSGDLGATRDLVGRVFREVDEEFPFERHLRPTAGAEEGLRAIHRAGGKTAIVTHDTASAARRHLAALGWEDLVSVVVGLDVCEKRKPDPESVLMACDALGVPPEETVMVGDTVTDLLAGRAAGCGGTIAVLTGLGTEEELAPYADLVVPDLTSISWARAA